MSVVASLTEVPPVGAGPLRVTVPVDETPPAIVVGLSTIETNDGGRTVIEAVLEMPSLCAVRVETVSDLTAVVVIVKDAEFWP